MNGRMDAGWMDDEWLDDRVVDARIVSGWVNGWMVGCVDVWFTVGWMDEG